jgi:hypothetical protein
MKGRNRWRNLSFSVFSRSRLQFFTWNVTTAADGHENFSVLEKGNNPFRRFWGCYSQHGGMQVWARPSTSGNPPETSRNVDRQSASTPVVVCAAAPSEEWNYWQRDCDFNEATDIQSIFQNCDAWSSRNGSINCTGEGRSMLMPKDITLRSTASKSFLDPRNWGTVSAPKRLEAI